jgi:hypothetical protein
MLLVSGWGRITRQKTMTATIHYLLCWITELSSEDEDGTLILRVSDMAVLNEAEADLAHVGEGLLHCHCMDGHCRSDFDIQG